MGATISTIVPEQTIPNLSNLFSFKSRRTYKRSRTTFRRTTPNRTRKHKRTFSRHSSTSRNGRNSRNSSSSSSSSSRSSSISSSSSSNSRNTYHGKKYPRGNWINTAKYYYIKHRILHAKLKTRNGNYVHASIKFNKNDILENQDGKFVIIGQKNYYTTDSFNVYYKNRKINISPMNFVVLGDGYAKNNFDVVFEGKKVNINVMGFKNLGYGYAKNNFDVVYKGQKIDVKFASTFEVLDNGKAKDNTGYFYKGKRIYFFLLYFLLF